MQQLPDFANFGYLQPQEKKVPLLVGDGINGDDRASEASDLSTHVTVVISEWGDDESIRNRARAVVLNPWFERGWLLVIILNCVTLSLEDPTDKDCVSTICKFTTNADYVFSLLFVFECAVKITGLGFFERHDSYLRDAWNILDFIIVLSGVAVFFLEVVVGLTGPGLAGVRAFRLLRPLKAVQAFPAVRILVQSILASLPKLADVFVLYFFFLLIMGVIAVQQWKGTFRWHCVADDSYALYLQTKNESALDGSIGDRVCTNTHHPNIGGHLCEWGTTCVERGGNPAGGKLSFDHIGVAALTLFVALTLEGWTETMYQTIDATTYIASFFWVVLIIFGSFFILNLTIVIITEAFETKQYEQKTAAFTAIDRDGGGELDRDEVRRLLEKAYGCGVSEAELSKVFNEMDLDGGGTVSLEEFLVYTETHQSTVATVLAGRSGAGQGLGRELSEAVRDVPAWNALKKALRALKEYGDPAKRESILGIWAYQVVAPSENHTTLPRANAVFRHGILFVIFLNTVVLSIEHHGQSQAMTDVLNACNAVFTIIFLGEACLKICGLGPYLYFADTFNCFDFVVSILSGVEVVGLAGANVSVFRTFRALRVLRFAKQVPILQRWVGILVNSVKGAAILTALLVLVIFIVALLGMQLFGGEFCFLDEDWDPYGYGVTAAMRVRGAGCGGVPRSNYDDLGSALITSFQILTGEDWNVIMYNGMTAVGDWVALYFVLYYILGNYMMLNLFIAVLLNSRDFKEKADSASHVSSLGDDEDDDAKKLADVVELPLSKDRDTDRSELDATGSPLASWKNLDETWSRVTDSEWSSPVAKGPVVLANMQPHGASDVRTAIAPDTFASREKQAKRSKTAKCSELPWLENWKKSDRSLFLLPANHPLRVQIRWIMDSTLFELVVLACITTSTVTLAIESPLRPPDHPTEVTLEQINFTMIWVFALEAVIKSVALGFALHPTSYLQSEGWNRLDFFIVCVSLVSLVLPGAESFDIVKIMRTLRPLRFINKSQGMKIVVQALVRSIRPLLNVLVISLVVWLIFGILGVQIFAGKFYRCSVEEYGDMENRDPPILTEEDCLNDTLCPGEGELPCRWLNYNSHFDHLPAAFLNLFEMASLEGWVTVMFLGVDSREVGEAPQKNTNPLMAAYFLVFIVFGAFFIINVFIGVLIDTYYQEKEKAKHGGIFLDDRQRKWVEHHTMMLNFMKGRREGYKPGSHTFLNLIVASPTFDYFIVACIVLNVVVMATEHYPASSGFDTALGVLNNVFYAVFVVEASLKIVDAGLKGYFKDLWNRFDFVIVVLSTLGVVMSAVTDAGPVVSIFRVLRLARLLRMVKRAQGIKRILRTLYLSIPSMLNVAGILFLMFFVFAVVGIKLFARIKRGDEAMGPYAHFENFGFTLLLLLRMTTGEGWQAVLSEASVEPPDCDQQLGECGKPLVATLYFCSFTLCGMYVLLNLFIAIILDAFSRSDDGDVCSEAYIKKVKASWCHHERFVDGDGRATAVHPDELFEFLVRIGPPLGLPSDASKRERNTFLMKLDLSIDPGSGLILREELIPKLFKAKYGQDLPEEIQRQLKEKEREHAVELPLDHAVDGDASLSHRLALIRIQAMVRGHLTRRRLREGTEREKDKLKRHPYDSVRHGTWPDGALRDAFPVYIKPPPGGSGVPLGFGLDPVTCRVTRVTKGSAGHRAGLTPGLKVTAVNGVACQSPDHCSQLIQYVTRSGKTASLDVQAADATDLLLEHYGGDDEQLNFAELAAMCRELGVPGPGSYTAFEAACRAKDLDPLKGYAWRDVHELMARQPLAAQNRVLARLKLTPTLDPAVALNPLSRSYMAHLNEDADDHTEMVSVYHNPTLTPCTSSTHSPMSLVSPGSILRAAYSQQASPSHWQSRRSSMGANAFSTH
ncbi:Voltage-dependent calcium channel type D subunit alpha-1 [Diplonema papillatum]|nr:Voltage-dependent calcium channel type D subunit alpha-1 [Diplonema papillatum]